MIALTARLNERDETIIQLQEELDAYERIHRDTELMVDRKQERIAVLEQQMQMHGVEVPEDEDGDSRPLQNPNLEGTMSQVETRKFTPYESYEMEGDNEDLPLQLLTAEEKVNELEGVVEHKQKQLEEM
mmetsp:Transcript_29510/g.28673  ORF Transcript_29510/g.28673 Transcript_29510/m.28673 type:complete len:129 (+) Transcript_29510:2018-2404(+)